MSNKKNRYKMTSKEKLMLKLEKTDRLENIKKSYRKMSQRCINLYLHAGLSKQGVRKYVNLSSYYYQQSYKMDELINKVWGLS
tara:strand:- start:7863 stop:8111 length:249 start_codon:yes stop_codon:yes gene_type:complete